MYLNFENATDDFMLAVCEFISEILNKAPDAIHKRFIEELYNHSDKPLLQELETGAGRAEEKRAAELIAPFIDHRRSAQEYLEKAIRDGWAGVCGKSLHDAFLIACALLSEGHVKQEEVMEDGDVCPSCGADKFIRFDDGAENCFDCLPSEDEMTEEEVQEAIDELEKQGLVEWTGEYRPARDGTQEKVWRAVEKRLLH